VIALTQESQAVEQPDRITADRMEKPDRGVAEEFRRSPLGHHSPNLQRVLTLFRGADMPGKYVLVCTKPHQEWVLGRLPAGRGEPVELTDAVFDHIFDAEWEVFKRRWEHYFGERLELD
jgi:branched-chain amino acid transport system permease protein